MTPIRCLLAVTAIATGLALDLPASAEEQRPPGDPYWQEERRAKQRPHGRDHEVDRSWWSRNRGWRSDDRDDRWRDRDRWDDDYRDRRDGRRWREREERRWSD
jgi:hypothetical protein